MTNATHFMLLPLRYFSYVRVLHSAFDRSKPRPDSSEPVTRHRQDRVECGRSPAPDGCHGHQPARNGHSQFPDSLPIPDIQGLLYYQVKSVGERQWLR